MTRRRCTSSTPTARLIATTHNLAAAAIVGAAAAHRHGRDWLVAVAGATRETYDSAASGLPHRAGQHTGSQLWLDLLARHAGYTPTGDDLDDAPVDDHPADGDHDDVEEDDDSHEEGNTSIE